MARSTVGPTMLPRTKWSWSPRSVWSGSQYPAVSFHLGASLMSLFLLLLLQPTGSSTPSTSPVPTSLPWRGITVPRASTYSRPPSRDFRRPHAQSRERGSGSSPDATAGDVDRCATRSGFATRLTAPAAHNAALSHPVPTDLSDDRR